MVINMTTTTATICKKIDIHNHIVFDVDDGIKSFDEAVLALIEAKKNKITDIVCTSHFTYKETKYNENFYKLKEVADKLKINLYMGNEIILNKASVLEVKTKRAKSLNNSRYILVELKRSNELTFDEIKELIEELIEDDFIIIFAHPELIKNTFIKKKELSEYRKLGVLFQVDADSYYKGKRRRVKRLLKWGFVDIISSDFHNNRDSFYYFTKFQNFLISKYNKKFVQKLFYDNPKKIIQDKKITM